MNVDSYIKRFEQWQKCTKTNDEQALSALGWHLAGQARCWFESLETPPETLDALKTALIAKFKREKTVDQKPKSKVRNDILLLKFPNLHGHVFVFISMFIGIYWHVFDVACYRIVL